MKIFDSIDSLMRGLSHIWWRVIGLPILIGLSFGVSIWTFVYRAKLHKYLEKNIEASVRNEAIVCSLIGMAIVLLFYFVSCYRARVKDGIWRVGEVADGLNDWMRSLLAGPFVVALFAQKIETEKPFFTLFIIIFAAILLLPVFGRLQKSLAKLSQLMSSLDVTHIERYVAPGFVTLLWITYGLFFSDLAIGHHHSFGTRAIDLGIYDNIFYQSSHGNPLGCSLLKGNYHGSAHFDPILVLMSPLYLIYPHAEFLLVFQSFWLGSAVFPAYLIGLHRGKSAGLGIAMAVAVFFFPAMHGANMYEFHSLSLLGMPMLWLLYFLMREKMTAYYITFAICLLIREDVALLTCFVGAGAILTRRPRQIRAGWLTVACSLVYFVVIKNVFMPSPDILMSGKDSYSYAYYYRDLIPKGQGLSGLIGSLVSNPAYVFEVVFSEAKVLHIFKLFLPLMFLPLLAGSGRFMMIYGAIFIFLASRTAVFSLHFQYSTVLYPVMIALIPEALDKIRDNQRLHLFGLSGRSLVRALVGCMIVTSVLCSWKYGGFWENSSFRGGFRKVVRDYTPKRKVEYEKFRELVDKIEPEAAVTSTDRLAAHLSNRMSIYLYRQAKDTPYVLVNAKDLKKKTRTWHKRRVKRKELLEVARHKGIVLYKKNPNYKKKKSSSKKSKKKTRGKSKTGALKSKTGALKPETGRPAPTVTEPKKTKALRGTSPVRSENGKSQSLKTLEPFIPGPAKGVSPLKGELKPPSADKKGPKPRDVAPTGTGKTKRP